MINLSLFHFHQPKETTARAFTYRLTDNGWYLRLLSPLWTRPGGDSIADHIHLLYIQSCAITLGFFRFT